MASRINPNAPFVRVYMDLPTATALKVAEHCATNNITRKVFLENAVTTALNVKGKGKKK